MTKPSRLPPIWVMGMTNATFGMMGSFSVVVVPQMLAALGVPGGRIAAITATITSPAFWVFILAPMLDVRLRRRTYALIFAALTAAAAGFTIVHHQNVVVVEVVMTAGFTAAALYQGAVGGWMGSLVAHEQDSSLGIWFTVANIGASSVMILLTGSMLHRWPPRVVGAMVAALLALPAILFLFIPAPPPDRTLARESFARFWRAVAALLRRREVLIALALFVLPSASFTLTNVLAGVGRDFSASEHTVSLFATLATFVGGLGGSFLLQPLAKKFALRPLYLGIGLAGAAFTLSLLLLPRAPGTFGLAITGENIFQSLAFAAGMAISFEVMGPGNPLAATLFTLLNSAVCLPITYMGFIDGKGYDWSGITGSFVTDAGLSIAACTLLAFLLLRLRRLAARDSGTQRTGPAATVRATEPVLFESAE